MFEFKIEDFCQQSGQRIGGCIPMGREQWMSWESCQRGRDLGLGDQLDKA